MPSAIGPGGVVCEKVAEYVARGEQAVAGGAVAGPAQADVIGLEAPGRVARAAVPATLLVVGEVAVLVDADAEVAAQAAFAASQST